MNTVLTTGSNRGVGLELTKQYVLAGDRVIATCRDPESATELQAVAATGSVEIVALDVTDTASVARAAESVGDTPIDVLINNAGIFGEREHDFGALDPEMWKTVLDANTIGPMRVAQAFAANLKRGANPRLISISSQMASLQKLGVGAYYYRSSKAALNMAMRLLANDLDPDGIIVCPVHPGWVQTDMGGSTADITPLESATGLKKLIDGLTREHSNRFWTWSGEEHPW